MNRKALIWGGVCGLIATFLGLFVGLQVSPMVANVLMFPIIGMSYVMGPFGMWNPVLMLVGLALSVVVWALIFGVVAMFLKRR